MLTAVETAKVWLWLDSKRPGAPKSEDTLQEVAEKEFGPITWSSQAGYGEGLIICKFEDHGIIGCSSGLCTGEEALLDALNKLIPDVMLGSLD